MLTGITMPGNSTLLRTGTMIMASGGQRRKVCFLTRTCRGFAHRLRAVLE